MTKSVLYIEDDTDTRELMTGVLEKEGFDVSSVATLHDAGMAMDASTFDVVISDYELPDGDGSSFIESAASLGRLHGARVVMITGHPSARRIADVPCWPKPVDLETIGAKVRAVLAKAS
jgi:DNA-binding NtrC family response regulator